MNEELPTCPSCNGHGEIITFHGVSLGTCDMCLGSKVITKDQQRWCKIGADMKEIRVKQRSTIHDAATQLGIKATDLSKMERGVIKPSFTTTIQP